MTHLLVGLFLLNGTLGFQDKKPANVARVEFRRVETMPAEGLFEAIDPKDNEKIYLHKKAELDNSDIKSALLDFDTKDRTFFIHLTFTNDGASKMSDLSKHLINKKLAITLDNNVVSTPVITRGLSKHVILGNLKKEHAEAIAKAFESK